ncbi:MAG: hypothetical protein NVS3B21_29480 [Acidimicrobiales bacterium]
MADSPTIPAMPRGHGETPKRTIRVDDELWAAALRVARDRREPLSEVIIRFLRRYVEEHPLDGD